MRNDSKILCILPFGICSLDNSYFSIVSKWYNSDIMRQIHAVVWKEGALFVAKALEVEVTSQGRTEKEGLENLKEALELYFEDQEDVELTSINNPKLQSLTI